MAIVIAAIVIVIVVQADASAPGHGHGAHPAGILARSIYDICIYKTCIVIVIVFDVPCFVIMWTFPCPI